MRAIIMHLFADITWTQLILIEIGSMLQFVALCEFVRERKSRQLRRQWREHDRVIDTHAQAQKLLEQETLLRVIHAGPRPPRDEEARMNVQSAAHLVKTAKVKFKQSFGFREQGSSHS